MRIALHGDPATAARVSGGAVGAELRRRGYAIVLAEAGTIDDPSIDLHAVLGDAQLFDGLRHTRPSAASVLAGAQAGTVEALADEIVAWKRLPWDTQFFAREIGTVTRRRITRSLGAFITKDCARSKLDCLYYLADCQDSETVSAAEENGFHFVDIRLTFARDLVGVSRPIETATVVRPSRVTDIPDLQDIAKNSYVASRYYFDGCFSRASCQQFYSEWIDKSCRGHAAVVLVAVDEDRPVGYISCQIGDGEGAIELVGVSERARGRSVGARLVRAALSWFRDQHVSRVTVVTQGRNYSAQRLYQRCGFVTAETQLWYHRWFHAAGR